MRRSTTQPIAVAVLAFCAGFLAVLVFHQGVLAVLHAANPGLPKPWNLRTVPPFRVPQVLSAAFWGGVWALVLGHLLRRVRGAAYWVTWIVVGAVALSLVAWLVVMPLKHLPMGGGWHPAGMVVALAVNGAWGLGTAAFLRLFGVQRAGG